MMAFLIAINWSGERVSSRESIWFNNKYQFEWGDEHPECRNKFAFWPDGKEMNPKYFDTFYGTDIGTPVPLRSDMPADAARDWVNKVRSEVSDCEEVQWMPIAKADAIRNERIALIAFAFVPPLVLFLAGIGIWSAWRYFAKEHWLSLPTNVRKGLLRLYLVVAVPWVAWFGYVIFDFVQHHHYWHWRDISHAFWSLLIVPIGGPILLLVIVWVISGFRKSVP
jgi:hypothetical protein